MSDDTERIDELELAVGTWTVGATKLPDGGWFMAGGGVLTGEHPTLRHALDSWLLAQSMRTETGE